MATTKSTVELNFTTSGLAQVKSGMDSLGATAGRLASVAGNVGKVLATVVTAVAALTGRAIAQADEMGKAAQRAGLGVDAFTALAFAAKLADVESGTLQSSIKKLSETMVDAAKGGGEAVRTFEELGVAFTDAEGRARPVDQMMVDLAARFESMPDGVDKVSLAVKLFGKSGQEMIPMLNAGKSGLQGMLSEARELGVVVGPEFANNAGTFMDGLSRVRSLFDGIFLQLADKLLPALNALLTWFIDWAKEYNPVRVFLEVITSSFFRLADTALSFAYGLEQIGTFLGVFGTDLAMNLDPAAAWAAAMEEMAKNGERYKAAMDALRGVKPPIPAGGAPDGGGGPLTVSKSAQLGLSVEQELKQVRFAQEMIYKSGTPLIDQKTIMLGLMAKEKSLLDDLSYRYEVNAEAATAKMAESTTDEGRAAAVKELRQAQSDQLGVQQQIFDLTLKQRDVEEKTTFMGRLTAGARDLQAAWGNLSVTMADGVLNGITSAVSGLAGALTSVVMGTKSAGAAFAQFGLSLLTNFISMILQAILWATVAIPILTALGVLSGGSTAAAGAAATTMAVAGTVSAVGGMVGRETGGSVIPGLPYMVGERRPEIFVPETFGRILPNVSDMGATTSGAGGGGGSPGSGGGQVVYVVQSTEEAVKQMAQRGHLDALIVDAVTRNRTKMGLRG